MGLSFSLDDYLWKLTYKWARSSHPNKPRYWVTKRYFGRFNQSRHNMWYSATPPAAPTYPGGPGHPYLA
jgi:hypothetical protein